MFVHKADCLAGIPYEINYITIRKKSQQPEQILTLMARYGKPKKMNHLRRNHAIPVAIRHVLWYNIGNIICPEVLRMNTSFAHNPLLPDRYFIPDVEAHVWADGRIYLYGSRDVPGNPGYCSDEYHVFSSDDLVNWIDHGVSFRLDQAKWYTGGTRALYAPDCAFRDGTYYLYYCVPDGRCGVARSDSPTGPFEDVGVIDGITGIDPAVLIDDDGQAYIYWGQFDGVRAARLRDNMTEIIPESVTQPLSVAEHDFHEGSSVKKIDGLYYFVYTDTHRHKSPAHSYGMATCLGYAVSENPMSGFRYGGVIIDNLGCDPGTWNNHGSICAFRGQWYVFYHRSTHGFEFSRHVCAEPISVADGHIGEVPLTSSGVGGGIPADAYIPASLACGLTGHARIKGETDESGAYALFLGELRPGDAAVFRYIDFDGESKLHIDLKGEGQPAVGVLIDGKPAEGAVSGRHEVTLTFGGDFSDAAVRGFTFVK